MNKKLIEWAGGKIGVLANGEFIDLITATVLKKDSPDFYHWLSQRMVKMGIWENFRYWLENKTMRIYRISTWEEKTLSERIKLIDEYRMGLEGVIDTNDIINIDDEFGPVDLTLEKMDEFVNPFSFNDKMKRLGLWDKNLFQLVDEVDRLRNEIIESRRISALAALIQGKIGLDTSCSIETVIKRVKELISAEQRLKEYKEVVEKIDNTEPCESNWEYVHFLTEKVIKGE